MAEFICNITTWHFHAIQKSESRMLLETGFVAFSFPKIGLFFFFFFFFFFFWVKY